MIKIKSISELPVLQITDKLAFCWHFETDLPGIPHRVCAWGQSWSLE